MISGRSLVAMTVAIATIGSVGTRQAAWPQSMPAIDATGSCPRTESLSRLNPTLNDGSIRGVNSRMASPVREGLPMYRGSGLTDPKVDKPPLSTDDDVEVMVGATIGSRGPALVRRMRDGTCGWIDAADVEKAGIPLKLIQVPGFGAEAGRRGRPSQLDARVVVKNRVDSDTGTSQRAPLFKAPFEGADEPPVSERRGNIGYFEVLSVYDVRRANGSACRNFFEPGCFLRVGTTTDAVRGSNQVTRQRGWMLGKDVEIWPSAFAVYYGIGKQGLKIHLNDQSARIGTPFADRGSEPKVLAFQPPGRFEEPSEGNIMRFPVIRGRAFVPRMQLTPGQAPEANSFVYEIVFSGQACIEERSSRSGCIPEPKVKEEVASLGKVVRSIANIDVLFVVDTTESMSPYLRSVVGAIRKHVTDLAARNDGNFRHSIAMYGDYNPNGADGLDFFALPFSQVNDLTGIDRLRDVKSYDDIHKDKPEAPFAALERAIKNANWSPEAAQRLVVWIGDHGNRKPGTYTTKGGHTLTEVKRAQDVIDAIRAVDHRMSTSASSATKTRFVALQVRGGANAASQAEFRQFRLDAEDIKKAIGESVFSTVPTPPNMTGESEVNALQDSLAKQIAVNVNAIAATRQAVLGALGGDMSGLQRDLPEALLAREYLAQLGFSRDRLFEIGRRIQLVRNGFVFQSGSDPDFRNWIGLRRPEFNGVRVTARELCENVIYSDRGEFIEEAILKLVRAITFGTPEPEETVRDFFSRIFSVPAEKIATVLETTPDEFMRRMRRQDPQNRQIIEKICRSARLLELIGENQSVANPLQDIVITGTQTSLRSGAKLKRFDWRWTSPDARSEWYFVPMDYLP